MSESVSECMRIVQKREWESAGYTLLGLIKLDVQFEEIVGGAVGGDSVDRRHGSHGKQRRASQQLHTGQCQVLKWQWMYQILKSQYFKVFQYVYIIVSTCRLNFFWFLSWTLPQGSDGTAISSIEGLIWVAYYNSTNLCHSSPLPVLQSFPPNLRQGGFPSSQD